MSPLLSLTRTPVPGCRATLIHEELISEPALNPVCKDQVFTLGPHSQVLESRKKTWGAAGVETLHNLKQNTAQTHCPWWPRLPASQGGSGTPDIIHKSQFPGQNLRRRIWGPGTDVQPIKKSQPSNGSFLPWSLPVARPLPLSIVRPENSTLLTK